jgi:hypothetical protein
MSPVDMMGWLSEGGTVHLIVEAAGLKDLSAFEATCRGGVRLLPSRHPAACPAE